MRATLLILVLAACGKNDPDVLPDLVLAWEVDDSRFQASPEEAGKESFTVLAADMDADGDPDVYFQRHHITRNEVFENRDGQLIQVNPRDDDRSGLYDNPGVVDLFDDGTMAQKMSSATSPGLYVWHDEDRGGRWHVSVLGPGMQLDMRVNRPFSAIDGLPAGAITAVDDYHVILDVPDDAVFEVDNPLVATQLVIEVLSDEPVVIYQGRSMSPDSSGRVELWKNDPHGVAWVDQLGGPEPEIFITRGGLTGLLAPPHDPKVDQYFQWSGGGETLWSAIVDQIPPDYCRGRQVTWLDVDLDSNDELIVSCTMTPNKILDPDAGWADLAPDWGADSVEPEAYAWVDVDGDGVLDLVQNQTETLEVLLHRGSRFERSDGETWGLVTPIPPSQEQGGVFNLFTLTSLDHDRDGDLDLWATHLGDDLGVAVLRNDGGAFTDATEDLGLGRAVGFSTMLPVDIDRDGWLDVYAVSATGSHAYMNQQGKGFLRDDIRPLAMMVDAAAADVDGDGNVDLVGLGPEGERRVVFDRHTGGGASVRVSVAAPLGTLVRGYYRDGSVQLHLHGGQTSRYSQVAEPIEFGSGAGPDRLQFVSVQWPGGAEGPKVSVDGTSELEL